MDLNKKNFNFDKTLTDVSNNKMFEPPSQREKLKLKIMDKYNINSVEVEKIILKLEKRKESANSKTADTSINNQEKMVYNNNNNNNNSANVKVQKDNNLNGVNAKFVAKNADNPYVAHNDSNNDFKSKLDFRKLNFIENNTNLNNKTADLEDVDSLLEKILPDYNKQISISLDHVDLTFELQNEKIDNLKETFIRALKRDKSKKIKIHALNDISFKIYKGEKVGIIGYNGAGKSTLLNVITGIFPPDRGTVMTFGNISPLLSLGAGFDYNFSGRKNIILNGAVLGYDKEFLESKMDEIIEFSELEEFIDIPIKNYSSGMLAKLGFSIATAVEPDILIIDEILGVGDVNFQKKSSDKMKSLMDGGTTVLLVSHSIPQIRELCDKAIWIDNGCLREFGEVNKVCDNYLKDAEKASNEQLMNIQFR